LGAKGAAPPAKGTGLPGLVGSSGGAAAPSGSSKIGKRPKRSALSDVEKQTRIDSETAWRILEKDSKEPFEYEWSEVVLLDVLHYLKEKKDIDYMEHSVFGSDWTNQWVIFDIAFKNKYFDDLLPSNFSEEDLLRFYKRHHKKDLPKNLKRAEYTREEVTQLLLTAKSALPEPGKAMWDGINIIHKYLELIDDKSVVMLQIW
jgi:hypothetical protein